MIKNLVSALLPDQTASAAVEFALIGPAFLAMFLGVMQVGIGMQNYNALRSISADTARWAVVNYQTGNQKTAIQMQQKATDLAAAAPYGLEASPRFTAFVSSPTTQRVAGATEFRITLTYQVRTLLSVIGIGEIPLTYTRPIFVIPS
ncbi:MAG: TadE/TadG family type IV pilus assembly protein [Pseudomonadota bacterium]|nr:TadE/TadG family type IV pilus assembly protein [Pseudomonadota bacterium]